MCYLSCPICLCLVLLVQYMNGIRVLVLCSFFSKYPTNKFNGCVTVNFNLYLHWLIISGKKKTNIFSKGKHFSLLWGLEMARYVISAICNIPCIPTLWETDALHIPGYLLPTFCTKAFEQIASWCIKLQWTVSQNFASPGNGHMLLCVFAFWWHFNKTSTWICFIAE